MEIFFNGVTVGLQFFPEQFCANLNGIRLNKDFALLTHVNNEDIAVS